MGKEFKVCYDMLLMGMPQNVSIQICFSQLISIYVHPAYSSGDST